MFYFYIAKILYIESLSNAKKVIALLKVIGIRKINFTSGEPFINTKLLSKLVKYYKETLNLETISLVTNGSKVPQKWLARYNEYLDIIAISYDFFVKITNTKIGRGTGTYLKTVINLS